MDRRQFLRATGAIGAVGTTGLAGCSQVKDVISDVGGGSKSVSNGESAAYNVWVGAETTDGSGGVNASSASGSILRRDWGSAQENQRIQDDALAMSVTAWAVPLSFGSRALGPKGVAKPASEKSNTERFTLVNGTAVFEGSFDVAAIGRVQGRNAERSEEYEGFTLYIHEGLTTAVSEETVLFVREQATGVSDPTARLEGQIDASKTESAQYAADHDAFDDLQSALPVRAYSGVEFNPDGGTLEGEGRYDFTTLRDTDLSTDVLGFAGSTDIEDDDMTISVALRYSGADAVDDRETIESELGGEADERAIEIDGPLVIVEGKYRDLSEN